MMNVKWTYLILVIAVLNSPMPGNSQADLSILHNASVAYEAGKFTAADSLYSAALENAPGDELGLYNRGVTRYESNRFDQAIPDFLASAESFTNDTLKSNAYYNLGNSYVKGWYQKDFSLDVLKAQIEELGQTEGSNVDVKMFNYLKKDSLLQEQKKILATKKLYLRNGINSYKDALRVSPQHNDARYNLTYAMSLLPKKKDPNDKNDEDKPQPTAFAKEIKKQALDLVRKHEFDAAYNLLMEGAKKDETVQQFEELIKNLKTIVDIVHEN